MGFPTLIRYVKFSGPKMGEEEAKHVCEKH